MRPDPVCVKTRRESTIAFYKKIKKILKTKYNQRKLDPISRSPLSVTGRESACHVHTRGLVLCFTHKYGTLAFLRTDMYTDLRDEVGSMF